MCIVDTSLAAATEPTACQLPQIAGRSRHDNPGMSFRQKVHTEIFRVLASVIMERRVVRLALPSASQLWHRSVD
jgi:hypothetical protein